MKKPKPRTKYVAIYTYVWKCQACSTYKKKTIELKSHDKANMNRSVGRVGDIESKWCNKCGDMRHGLLHHACVDEQTTELQIRLRKKL